MDENAKRIAEGLLKAIKAENDGYHFYSMSAKNIHDERGREIFETLAKEEQDHHRFLKAQYKAVVETGQPDENVRLGDRLDLSGPNPIFSGWVQKNIAQAGPEMSALSIGIQLELSSMNFYREQAKAAGKGPIRDFYNQLADWEQGHYHALVQQEEALKEDYWAAAGFVPF
jgi:rubrerythrin